MESNSVKLNDIQEKLNTFTFLIKELEDAPRNDRFENILAEKEDIKDLTLTFKEIEKNIKRSDEATRELDKLWKNLVKIDGIVEENIDPLTVNLLLSADKIAKNID